MYLFSLLMRAINIKVFENPVFKIWSVYVAEIALILIGAKSPFIFSDNFGIQGIFSATNEPDQS